MATSHVVMWKKWFPNFPCLRSQRQDFADSAGRTAPLAARMARSPASAPGRSRLSVRHLQVSSPVAKATWDGRACGETTTWRNSTIIRQTWIILSQPSRLKMTAEVNHVAYCYNCYCCNSLWSKLFGASKVRASWRGCLQATHRTSW